MAALMHTYELSDPVQLDLVTIWPQRCSSLSLFAVLCFVSGEVMHLLCEHLFGVPPPSPTPLPEIDLPVFTSIDSMPSLLLAPLCFKMTTTCRSQTESWSTLPQLNSGNRARLSLRSNPQHQDKASSLWEAPPTHHICLETFA